MKKIGFLIGPDEVFPNALIDYINETYSGKSFAESIKVGITQMQQDSGYDVILDLVSSDVPYYTSFLKSEAFKGVNVVNNPYLCNSNDNFLLINLARKLEIPVLKTAILPTKERPYGTHSEHYRNMVFPIIWEELFDYIGFPAIIKPNAGNSFNHAFKVYNPEEFHNVYDTSGSKVMMVQEAVDYDETFRCYVIGNKKVYSVYYDARKPVHMRFYNGEHGIPPKIRKSIESIALQFTNAVGLEFNAMDFVLKDKMPYPIDFINAPPFIDHAHMPPNIFRWLVETLSDYLVNLKVKPSQLPNGIFSAENTSIKKKSSK